MAKPPPRSQSFRPVRPQAGRPPKSSVHKPSGPPPRHRDQHGEPQPALAVSRAALIYGTHAVAAAWINPARRCRHLFGTEAALAELAPALAEAAAAGLRRPPPVRAERDALDRMLPPGSVHQGLALDAEPLDETSLADVLIAAGDGPVSLVLLDQVTDPHNVGAVLRSAAAFGAKGLVVQRRHAPEVSGVLAKAASGAVEIVPILRETNLARALEEARDAGLFAIGLDEGGEAVLGDVAVPDRTILALGAEGSGLRRLVGEGCNLLARLPTQPPILSLNVSNAAAVGLYEIARRQNR